MTPKDKAIELYNIFEKLFIDANADSWSEEAKKCAIICVDEVIQAIDWHEFETPNSEIKYWNDVKSEIEKL